MFCFLNIGLLLSGCLFATRAVSGTTPKGEEIGSISSRGNTDENISSNDQCFQKLSSIVMNNLTRLQYIDALGKPGVGMMKGNLMWQGGFDECLEMKNTKYCYISKLKLMNNSKLAPTWGICAPIECSNSDIVAGLQMVQSWIDKKNLSKYIAFPNNINDINCPEKLEQTSGSKTMIAISGLLASFCFLGTILEILLSLMKSDNLPVNKSRDFMPVCERQQDPENNESNCASEGSSIEEEPLLIGELNNRKPINRKLTWARYAGNVIKALKNFLLCFSLIKNTKAVLSTESPPGAITSLHGIRTISMWWVILGHTFLMGAPTGIDNVLDVLKIVHRFTFLPIINGTFSVDSFFLLSGLLVSYLSLRRFDKRGKLPLVQFYVHRYLRLTPSYIFVIVFLMYVYQLLGDGPQWRIAIPALKKTCQKYWWTNILYINNFYPKVLVDECIGWSWYLAIDMQFHIISPLILYLMYRFKFVGTLVVNTIICVASFVVTAALLAYYNFVVVKGFNGEGAAGVQNIVDNKNPLTYVNAIYTKPYCRIPPYLIGLVLGYILHHKIRLTGQFKWIIVLCGWCCAIIFGLSVVYGTWKVYKVPSEAFTKADNVIYGTFSRFTWGLALAWVIYACHFGYGGLVNKILSWKAFIPLSRLTYGAYLLHPLVIFLYYYTMQATRHYTDLQISFQYFSVVGMSYMAALLLAIWIEFPFANLEKLVFSNK